MGKKKSGKTILIKVREKSANFATSQEILYSTSKTVKSRGILFFLLALGLIWI